MDNPENQDALDPELKALLELLQPAPPRSNEAAKASRSRYLAEIQELFTDPPGIGQPTSILALAKEKLNMLKTVFKQRPALTGFVALVVVLILVASGAGVTAAAARAALPGDALYPVKTSLEQTQANLSGDSAQVALYLKFAGLRLDEIEQLISQGRFDDIQLATVEFENYAQLALSSLKKVAAADPTAAAGLASEIASELTRYATALGVMQAGLPDQVRLELQHTERLSERGGAVQAMPDGEIEFVGAIEQINPTAWTIGGQQVLVNSQTELEATFQVGDIVKVHAAPDGNGDLVAREIDFAEGFGDDDGNVNANFNDNGDDDNGNGNDNGIDNENENENDNGNINENENENDNDNGNTNGNINDNENENDNDNGNTNGNVNNNDNENDNGNNNSNDNDHDDDSSSHGFWQHSVLLF